MKQRSVAGESRAVARALDVAILAHPVKLAPRVRTDGEDRQVLRTSASGTVRTPATEAGTG